MKSIKIRAMKYLRIFSIIVAFFIMNACSEDFLDVRNENNLSENNFYKTEEDFEKLLITCYMPLAFSNLYGNSYHVLNYAMDDRVLHEQFATQNLQFDATNGFVEDIFYGIYTGIYRCNLFFDKWPEEITIDVERQNTMFGEAHFLRGLYYYHAAWLFEVPPLLFHIYEPGKIYGNSTQDSIYDYAEAELELAINLLPLTWDDDNFGRATKGAAMAFLGKTYLYRQKWQEAADIFEQVINLGLYELSMPVGTDSLDYVYAYLCNFSHLDLPAPGHSYTAEHNSEYIFDVEFSEAYTQGFDRAGVYLPGRRETGSHLSWYNSFINGYKNIAMDDDKFPAEFESPSSHPAGLKIDPRYYAIYIWEGDTLDYRDDSPLRNTVLKPGDLNSALGTKAGLRKYYYPFNITFYNEFAPYHDAKNWRLIRYADVLLMYAEAVLRAEGGTSTTNIEALNAINKVRNRAGLDPLSSVTKNAIMHERDIELCAEHQRYWDLVRWYQSDWLTIDEVREYKPYFQPRHVCLPIPLDLINDMKGYLKQNEKW
jgi:hypothetical protein